MSEPSITSRLVTLQPLGDAVDAFLDVIHAIRLRRTGSTMVGNAPLVAKLPGQPDGHTVADLTTSASDMAQRDHMKFILDLGAALNAHGVPYAWQCAGGDWHHVGARVGSGS